MLQPYMRPSLRSIPPEESSELAMIRLRRNLLAGLGLTLAISACDRYAPLPVHVHSLEEALPTLEEAAQVWSSDAYLADVEVPLRDGYPGERVIDAGFQSPSAPYESLLVTLREDDTLTTEIIPQTVPVIQSSPITRDDWVLDSADALERALDEEGRRFFEGHAESHCSFLKLERDTDSPGWPVVWRLTLTECLGRGGVQHTVIDAITGEVIQRRQFEPFPSPTP